MSYKYRADILRAMLYRILLQQTMASPMTVSADASTPVGKDGASEEHFQKDEEEAWSGEEDGEDEAGSRKRKRSNARPIRLVSPFCSLED